MIPLSVPNISALEKERVAAALESGWVSTAGPDVKAFEQALAAYTGAGDVVAVNSGTAALHLALKAIDVQEGDLVLVPNLTFTATLNAVKYLGAEPILVDIDPQTLQMDPNLVAAFLTEETAFRDGACYHQSGARIRAILPVHILGYPADLDALAALARSRGILLVEDAAAAVGVRKHGRHLGTTGLLGTLSFNGNKVLTTGGGGAVLTHDSRLADRIRHLAGQAKSFPTEYIHDDIGYNYGMTNLAAAMGLAQLERLEGFLERKRAIHAFYKTALTGSDLRHFSPPQDGVTPNHWLETIFHPQARNLEIYLGEKGIQARKLWVPMNRLPMYIDARYLSKNDHSYQAYEESLCLPCSSGITDQELKSVAAAVNTFAAAY